MLNHVVLIGRLTRNPDLKYTQSGKAVANFTLAVDRGTTDAAGNKETDFIDVVVWERQAETVANHLSKGRLVAVQGRLQIRKFENQQGQKREKAEVVAIPFGVKFLDRGDDAPRQSMGRDVSFDDDSEDSVPF